MQKASFIIKIFQYDPLENKNDGSFWIRYDKKTGEFLELSPSFDYMKNNADINSHYTGLSTIQSQMGIINIHKPVK